MWYLSWYIVQIYHMYLLWSLSNPLKLDSSHLSWQPAAVTLYLLSFPQAHAHAVVYSLVRNLATIIKRDSSDQVRVVSAELYSQLRNATVHTFRP